MIVKIPITGTVLDFDPVAYRQDKIGAIGDPDDPIRPIAIDLGGVGWKLISLDLVNDLAEIEIEAPEQADRDVLGINKVITLTPTERQKMLDTAKGILKRRTTDELYFLSGDKKLVKSAIVEQKVRSGIV